MRQTGCEKVLRHLWRGTLPCLVTEAHPAHGIGSDAANIPTLPWTSTYFQELEAPLKSGGTPRAKANMSPGECRVPGLPNKAFSKPRRNKKPPHFNGRYADYPLGW